MTLTRRTPMPRASKPMRSKGPKMTPARKAARGMPCMIRVPGICNHNPETTVLCHYRIKGYDGMGLKPSDDNAAWGCSDCHAFVDGRIRRPAFISYSEVRLMHAEGVMRTQMARKGVA